MSDDGDFIELLRQQGSVVMTTLQARRHRETQPVAAADRRLIRTPRDQVRSEQLNLRVSPRFRQRLAARAAAEKLSLTEVLVRAFDAYCERPIK